MADREPRQHHHLPRFYQRGFANDREQIRVLDRNSGREYTTNIVNVAQRRDWNAFEDEAGNRRQEVEKLLGKLIDTPAASAFHELRAGHFSFEDEEMRAAVARFAAAQLTRGPGPRENFNQFSSEVMRMALAVAAQNAPDEYWERVAGEVPTPELREELAERRGVEIRPTRASELETMLGPIDDVARVIYMRSWSLITVREPSLFTSVEPVILAGPRDMSLGVGTADEIHLPVSPTAALVMTHPKPHWEDRLAEASPAVASRLNTWHVARSNTDTLLLDPRIARHPLDGEAEAALPVTLRQAFRGRRAA